jgi:hypothetical protein
MSTVFLRLAAVPLLVAACGGAARPAPDPLPAPTGSAAEADRAWKRIAVGGPYGGFEMAVPVISIAPASGTTNSIVLDSAALHEVEKRLTSRIAGIARAQASAVFDSVSSAPPGRNPAPLIRTGLLGEIAFEEDVVLPTPEGVTRITAVAVLLRDLAGRIEVRAHIHGTGAARFDIAAARARRVYLALLEAEPGLAGREVELTARTIAVLPGAPVPQPVVAVYYTPQ